MATRAEQILAKAEHIKQVREALTKGLRKEEELKQVYEDAQKAKHEIEEEQRRMENEDRLRSTGVISIFEEIRENKILLFKRGSVKYEDEMSLRDDPSQTFLGRLIVGPRRLEVKKRVAKGRYDDEPAHLIVRDKRACLIFDYWKDEGDDWGKYGAMGSKCIFAELDKDGKLYLWFGDSSRGDFPPEGYWLGGRFAKGAEAVQENLDDKIAEILSKFLK